MASWVRLHVLCTWSFPNAGLCNICAPSQSRLVSGLRWWLHLVLKWDYVVCIQLVRQPFVFFDLCREVNWMGALHWVPKKLIVEIMSNSGRNARLFILHTHGNRLQTCFEISEFYPRVMNSDLSNSHNAPSFTTKLCKLLSMTLITNIG